MCRFLILLFLLNATWTAWASGGSPPVAGPSVLTLVRGADDAQVWPALTLLSDPDGSLSPEQVLARRDQFVRPTGPASNLGIRRDTVWLRLTVSTPTAGPDRWILSLDYASLDRIDVYLLSPGQDRRHWRLGRSQPFSARDMPSSSLATTLPLAPGQTHELLLRVQTASTMVLPVSLLTPEAFHWREARTQLLQGLMGGAAICLLVYSLAQWVSLRELMFPLYALTLAGASLFFFAYSGLGPQHLWGENAWLSANLSPLSVLIGLVGAYLFIDRALEVRSLWPRVSVAMRAGSVISGLTATAFMGGLIDYRIAQTSATILGPLPMLLAMPVAWRRARHGDRIGVYMLAGWGVYGITTLIMAGLLRGYVPWNFWTRHAFQFGSLFEMLMWMRVLGVHVEDLRASAQRAHLERDALRRLAHTDALTGLPNRRGLNETLARVLPQCTADNLAAIYLIDLDGFKSINDRHGHEAGDALLVGVARRLESLVRSTDLVARLGGDEFVIVARSLAEDADARRLGEKLVRAFDLPVPVQQHAFKVGATIGYALAPLDGQDPASLMKRADAAMYAGKENGRHCLRRGAAAADLS